MEIKSEKALAFFKRNWLQLAIVLAAVYFLFKKDLTFQIRVLTPDKTEKKTAGKPKEKYTDASPSIVENPTVTDRAEMPLAGFSTTGKKAPSEMPSIDESVRHAFLERFAKVAVAEQQKFGIPASVILATALHQSVAGKSQAAAEANNFFSIPCSGNWNGPCATVQDQRYRRYATAWESFRDFSLFAREYFSSLAGEDYHVWARGMQKSGFGEDDDFAKKLVGIIEGYRLQELDR